jgi:aryl-alcohol dehydrogenase-like predicted oxidoreductase
MSCNVRTGFIHPVADIQSTQVTNTPIEETVSIFVVYRALTQVGRRCKLSTMSSRLDMPDILACRRAMPGSVSLSRFPVILRVSIPSLVHAMQSTSQSYIGNISITFVPDYAITHNLTPFISMQNQYSLVYREEEREMFPTLKVRSLS